MEFNSTCLYSFLVVCAVSSLSVSIGTGGGLLYVPILGLLYHDVALGVYLSKISILITSFIGTTYHICNDAYLLIKSSKYKSDEESHSDLTPKTVQPPRVYFVLAASLVPSCIVGTNLGTRFHFFAKRHLKILLTSAVAFSMLVTFLKLYLIYKNRKNKLNFQPESKNFETPTIENSNAEVVSKNFISHILEPYSNSSLHTIKMRSISLAIILFCIILYYIAVRFEDSFTPIPILVLLCTIGVYFSIKLRMSFRLSKEYDETTDSDSDEESQVKEKRKARLGNSLKREYTLFY